jgi:hypothetical protein
MFLLIKAKYLRYSFFNLSIEMFFLYLDRLLVRYKGYLVLLTIVIGLVLTSILGATSILRIRDNHIIIRLAIEVNRFLTTSIQCYLVSVLLDIIP